MNKKDKLIDIAVALNYDGKDAPRVTAKGYNEVADLIKTIADNHNIPLFYEPILAEVLSHVELGEQVPESLFRAVAEIIAFAYILSGKTPNL